MAPLLLGQRDDAVELAAEVDQLGQDRDAALEAEQAHRHAPALAGLADDQVARRCGRRSKKTSLNSEPPVSCSIGRTSTPSWSIGTSRNDSPWCRSRPGSVRAMTKSHWLKCALDVHTFWPSMTHSPRRRGAALVCTLARSEPASGSE